MELLDLTTSAGIAAATGLVLEFLKKVFASFELKSRSWYGTIINLNVVIIAFGLSFLSIPILDVTFQDSLSNGLIGSLLAIGGYESVINIIRGFLPKK